MVPLNKRPRFLQVYHTMVQTCQNGGRIIPDKLGIWIKKTAEYTIAYYLKAEISRVNPIVTKLSTICRVPRRKLTRNQFQRILMNSSPNMITSYEIPSYLADRTMPSRPA